MPEYTWSFANSFLVFMLIAFATRSIATATKNYIPMPLLYGLTYLIGFTAGWIPRDMVLSSNMVTVGTIAFNVLVVHCGTNINLKALWANKKESAVLLLSPIIMAVVCLIILPPIIGRELAFMAPGAVVGGGASCAVASRTMLGIHPEISFFPWMIFMFQGIFCIPIIKWALNKERDRVLKGLSEGTIKPRRPEPPKPIGLCAKIPQKYKITAYYLGSIMMVTAFNYFLQGTVLKNAGINRNATALILGIILGNTGILERGPLMKSDCYGLLILSLMGLMANNLSNTPASTFISLVPAVLLCLLVGSVTLFLCALGLSKLLHVDKYRAIILTMNPIMGSPVDKGLAEDAVENVPEQFKEPLKGRLFSLLLSGTVNVGFGISILLASLLIAFV